MYLEMQVTYCVSIVLFRVLIQCKAFTSKLLSANIILELLSVMLGAECIRVG